MKIKKQNRDFTKKLQQPNEHERESLLRALYNMNKRQIYLSKIFKSTPQQIYAAFAGKQPTLMNKIKKHVELLQQKQSKH